MKLEDTLSDLAVRARECDRLGQFAEAERITHRVGELVIAKILSLKK